MLLKANSLMRRAVFTSLTNVIDPSVPWILAGDFNSLKREDYNQEKWEEISKVTRKCVDLFRFVKTADNCNLR